MEFQILDSKGNALKIKDLDKEACSFFKVEERDKYFAYPRVSNYEQKSEAEKAKFRIIWNWYDTIGWHIANSQARDWETVKESIISIQEDEFKDQYRKCEEVQSLFALVDYWSNKGYTPLGKHY